MKSTWAAIAALALLAACTKKTAEPAATGGDAGAVALPQTASAATADKPDQAKLLKTAALVRCQLTGYAPPDEKVYSANGYASAAAFAEALDAAAKADPQWAQQTLAAVYAQPCPGQHLRQPTLPPPATPATGETGGAAP